MNQRDLPLSPANATTASALSLLLTSKHTHLCPRACKAVPSCAWALKVACVGWGQEGPSSRRSLSPRTWQVLWRSQQKGRARRPRRSSFSRDPRLANKSLLSQQLIFLTLGVSVAGPLQSLACPFYQDRMQTSPSLWVCCR